MIMLLNLGTSLGNQLLDFTNCLRGIQALGAGIRTVHNGVATVQFEWIFKRIKTVTGGIVAAV